MLIPKGIISLKAVAFVSVGLHQPSKKVGKDRLENMSAEKASQFRYHLE